jgi:hypothetical protein
LSIRESFTRVGIPLYFIETLILVAPIVADVGIETVPLTGELEVAPMVITCSPASSKSPSALKSIRVSFFEFSICPRWCHIIV